jgi:YidC/Oxa1 family membrane protein insertase
VNKNLLLAISLIFLTLMLFNSPLYNKTYEKIFKQKRQSNQIEYDIQKSEPIGTEKTIRNDTVLIKKTEELRNRNNFLPQAEKPLLKMAEDSTGDTLWIENEKVICGISEIGARIISIKMKDFLIQNNKDNNTKEYIDLIEKKDIGGGNLEINGLKFDKKKFICSIKNKNVKVFNNDKKEIDFTFINEDKSELIKRFIFEGNSYKIGFDILSKSLDGKSITVGWKCGITESENQNSHLPAASGVSEPRIVHVFDSKNVAHIQLKKVEKEEETGFFEWAGITSKYFFVAMVADSIKNTDLLIESYDATIIDEQGKRGSFLLDYGFQLRRSGEGAKESFWIYAGPSKFLLVKSFHKKFEKVLFSGWEWLLRADLWFPVICEWTLWLLISINGIIKDYGFTILILTILTKLITYPLSQSSMKSMSKMKDIQPKINHLRERFKSNPKKMNEEIMALYKKEGVNPFNPGCLPMFLQMPILFALFIVLRKAIELRGAHTMLIPWVSDLSQPESLISLTGIFPNGIPMYGSSIALLPILMAILKFFQNKMTIKDPNQKMMIYFMPIFMLFLFNNFPAGLVLYWTFQNAFGILQQYLLEKNMKSKAVPLQAVVQTENRKPIKRR